MPLSLDAKRVLYYLSEHEDERLLPTVLFPRTSHEALHDELLRAGYLTPDDRLVGPPLFGLSRTGRYQAGSGKRGFRAEIVRDRVLRAVADGVTNVTEVVAEPADGGDFSSAELEGAALALDEWGFIKASKGTGGKPVRCEITTKGQVQLESMYAATGEAPAAQVSNVSNTINNREGSSGSMQVGDHNVMTVNQSNGATLDEVMSLLVKVRRIADSSDNPAAVAYGNTQIEEIETAVEDGRFETARALVSALLNSAVVAFGASIGEQLHGPLAQVGQLIGDLV